MFLAFLGSCMRRVENNRKTLSTRENTFGARWAREGGLLTRTHQKLHVMWEVVYKGCRYVGRNGMVPVLCITCCELDTSEKMDGFGGACVREIHHVCACVYKRAGEKKELNFDPARQRFMREFCTWCHPTLANRAFSCSPRVCFSGHFLGNFMPSHPFNGQHAMPMRSTAWIPQKRASCTVTCIFQILLSIFPFMFWWWQIFSKSLKTMRLATRV